MITAGRTHGYSVAGRRKITEGRTAVDSIHRGPAGWDERHRLVALADIEVGYGVQAALKTIYSSGRPFNAVTGEDDNLDRNPSNDRPPGEGRNARRGPDFFSIDFGIRRAMTVGQGQFALTMNVYNALNRTNLLPQSVVGNLSSENFGQALTAYPKRQVEIGVQLRR